MIDLDRKSGESELEYQFRISSMKDAIGTWGNVADVINHTLGYNYGESKYRKDYTIFSKMLDVYSKQNVSNSDDIAKLEQARSELRKERQKMSAVKSELLKAEKHNARLELCYESIKDSFDRLEPPTPKLFYFDKNAMELVLTIADLHYGATFKSTNNEYSRQICEDRLWELLACMREYRGNVKKIKVLNLGDTIQGILRLKDLQLNDIPVVEAVVEVSRLIAAFLNELSEYFEIEYYHCSSANHTQIRPLGSKANELASEDLEKIIVNNIELSLRDNDRVKVFYDLKSDYIDFNVMGFSCVATHGHQIKQRGATLMDGLSNLRGIMYDYIFIGHDHSAKEEICYESGRHNREVLTCPSFIGSDPYSDSLLRGSRPGAKIFLFDEQQGHIVSRMILL